MAETVVTLFRASRWVAGWEALGGHLYLGLGPFGPDGEDVTTLLEMKPTHLASSSPEWRQLTMLQGQLATKACRDQVTDFLQRRQSTRGW